MHSRLNDDGLGCVQRIERLYARPRRSRLHPPARRRRVPRRRRRRRRRSRSLDVRARRPLSPRGEGSTGRWVQRVHMQMAQRKRTWPSWTLPRERGACTAVDVMRAAPGPERDRAIDAWCVSVWTAICKSRQRRGAAREYGIEDGRGARLRNRPRGHSSSPLRFLVLLPPRGNLRTGSTATCRLFVSSRSVPPWASAICRLNGHAIPEPAALVVKNGTNRFDASGSPSPSSSTISSTSRSRGPHSSSRSTRRRRSPAPRRPRCGRC